MLGRKPKNTVQHGLGVLLSVTAFSCSLAAEFHKIKEKDMKLDGSLCSLPKSSAFELGVAAIAFLSVAQLVGTTAAQLVGTTAAATTMCDSKPNKSATTRGRVASVALLVLLSVTAFSCSLAAEFHKIKEKDMKLDGSLCSLPKSSAFELGVAAIAFLSVAQLIGTTAAATTMCDSKPNKSATTRGRVASVALLVLSWVTFALAVILLATCELR